MHMLNALVVDQAAAAVLCTAQFSADWNDLASEKQPTHDILTAAAKTWL